MSFPRYPAYKDSGLEAVGAIPVGWTPTRLKFLLQAGYDGLKIGPFGSQLTSDMLVEGGKYKVYGQENVIASDFIRGSRFIDGGKFQELSVYEIHPGDLLITMMGTSGRCDVAPTDMVPGIMDSHLLRMRVTQTVLAEFVRLLVDEAPYVGTQIELAGKGSIMHGLNSTIVKDLVLFVPPDDEQSDILAFLDRETAKIDALVAEQRRLMALLKEKRQAVISHAVTKGLNPDAPMKPSGIEWLGDVPEHWDTRSIAKASTKITNGFVGPTRDILVEAGTPYIQATHIKNGCVNFDDGYFVRPEWSAAHSKSILREGDVLIVQTGAGTGDVGLVSKNEVGYNCHALIIVAPDKSLLHGAYLSAVLQSTYGQETLSAIETGAMHPHLNCGEVKFVEIPLPPLQEQLAIVNYINESAEQFNTLIAEAQRAIDLLQERRTALISAAVTGQIDVRNASESP